MRSAKAIAKVLAKDFRELARSGELARMGKTVAAAINKLRAERRLTHRQMYQPVTI